MQIGAQHLIFGPLVGATVAGIQADVQVCGVPFDGTSTYRPGSRFGPDAIREAFLNIEIYSRQLDVDLEALSIEDAGNLRHTASVETMVRTTAEAVSLTLAAGRVPAVLGGEHSITFATLGAMPPRTALLVFDAHLDLREQYDDLTLMHATYLRRSIERQPDLRVVHVGGRAATRAEWAFAADQGVTLIEADEIAATPRPAQSVAAALAGIEGVYVSIDLDVLDPAYAPGVSNPEPGGMATRQLVRCLDALRGMEVRGLDIVELCPPHDHGGITAVAAARLLAELCCLIALNRGTAPV
jgi:agmatinase